jgi:transposase
MKVILERVCGLDVHRDTVKACVRRPGKAGEQEEILHTFGTHTADLLALRDWLQALAVTHVALESAGSLGHPVACIIRG